MSMVKKAGRRVTRQRSSKSDFGDITLNDFANSTVTNRSGRLKKNIMNKVVTEVKQLNISEDDRPWDEKLHELELQPHDEDREEEEVEIRKPSSRHRKRTVTDPDDSSDQATGADYPIDIWFLISEHVHPENVGVFSAICKTSLAVVSTAKFWFCLYKRYYKSVANMPEILQPECMVRRYGLRACVIRALHFMYPLYVTKVKPQMPFDDDPHSLTKRQCIFSWSKKNKNQWIFYFKLKQLSTVSYGRRVNEASIKPDLLEMLEDITANVDDQCKVLQVTSLNYTQLPMISGQTLRGVSLTLSQGLRHHRLQLSFACSPSPCATSNNPIVLDPVVNLRVLDWWHPSYPHTDGLSTSLFYDNTRRLDEFDL